jgi:hypothetical protein
MEIILHAMMHTIAIEDEAKRKVQGQAGGAAARLTAEELEKVFGGNQGAAWVPTTGTKGRRSFQDWILRTLELCKKALVKTQQPGAGDIMHCAIGATEHYKGLVASLSMTTIDDSEANFNVTTSCVIPSSRRSGNIDSLTVFSRLPGHCGA